MNSLIFRRDSDFVGQTTQVKLQSISTKQKQNKEKKKNTENFHCWQQEKAEHIVYIYNSCCDSLSVLFRKAKE